MKEGEGRFVHSSSFSIYLSIVLKLSQVHFGPEQRARGRLRGESGGRRSESQVQDVDAGQGRWCPRCLRTSE